MTVEELRGLLSKCPADSLVVLMDGEIGTLHSVVQICERRMLHRGNDVYEDFQVGYHEGEQIPGVELRDT